MFYKKNVLKIPHISDTDFFMYCLDTADDLTHKHKN